MRSLVEQGKRNPRIVSTARKIVGGQGERDYRGEIGAVTRWVRRNIRFVNDPVGVETLSDPWSIVKNRAGDCDDHVVLLSSLLESVGHKTRARVIGRDPDHYSHVYLEVFDRSAGAWVPVDPSVQKPVGWAPPPRPASEAFALGELKMGNPFAYMTPLGTLPDVPEFDYRGAAKMMAASRYSSVEDASQLELGDLGKFKFGKKKKGKKKKGMMGMAPVPGPFGPVPMKAMQKLFGKRRKKKRRKRAAAYQAPTEPAYYAPAPGAQTALPVGPSILPSPTEYPGIAVSPLATGLQIDRVQPEYDTSRLPGMRYPVASAVQPSVAAEQYMTEDLALPTQYVADADEVVMNLPQGPLVPFEQYTGGYEGAPEEEFEGGEEGFAGLGQAGGPGLLANPIVWIGAAWLAWRFLRKRKR